MTEPREYVAKPDLAELLRRIEDLSERVAKLEEAVRLLPRRPV